MPTGNALTRFLGINPLEQNFNYKVSTSEYDPNNYMTGAIGNLNNMGGQFDRHANEMFDTSQGFLDPSSQWSRDQYSALREGVGDTTAQSLNQANTSLAQRGGTGGMSGLLGSILRNRGGEQVRQGTRDIRSQGAGLAGQFAGLGMQGLQGATSAYGQAGGLGSAMDARALNNNQFNAKNLTDQARFASQMGYQQASDNRQAKSAFANSLIGLAGGLVAPGLSGAFSNFMGVDTKANVGSMFGGSGYTPPALPQGFGAYGGMRLSSPPSAFLQNP